MKIRINTARPIEELIGQNYGIVRQILGRVHVSKSVLQAARAARGRNMRKVPVALRRGWAKCVIETWAEYRQLYVDVVTGNLGGDS